MRQHVFVLWIVGLASLAFGCDEDSASNSMMMATLDAGGGPSACTPDREGWESVRATVETYCGLCHGEVPAFGAPNVLVNYDGLLDGAAGGRSVDRLVARMRAGDMPPVGQPAAPAAEALALLEWATCGENSGEPPPGPNPGGFDVTRPVFAPEVEAPVDANVLEMRADNGHIPADVADQYTCFSFKGPPGGERFLRRIEPVIDDARVLHHIVLYEVPEGPGDGREIDCGTNLSAAVYAWAPGQQPVQFVEGGLITDDSRRYVLEIHYNNTGAYTDVADQSGLRVFHTEPEGPAIDMLTIGPDGFRLPARTRTKTEGVCVVEEPMTVIATLPHMHELGVSLASTVERSDGSSDDLITLNGWDFDSQLFYDTEGLQLLPGDRVRTECVFENSTDIERRFGAFTEDEMCFNFLFVTPPPAERRCNQNEGDTGYMPGQCAPDIAAEIAVNIESAPVEGEAPQARGGLFPRGDWRLVDYTLVLESADTGLAVLDLDETSMTSAGALRITEEGRFNLDVAGELQVVLTNGGTPVLGIGASFGGTIIEDDPDTGSLQIALDCPEDGQLTTTYTYEDERLTFYLPFMRMATGVAVPVFERVE